jgi:molybdate transport system substrate-binding protein
MLARHALVLAAALLAPAPSFAQLQVLASGGFGAAYRELLPVFETRTGIKVTTTRAASQGSGSNTIPALIRAGTAADVVILSKEGLAEVVAQGRILAGSAVDLARVRLGVAVPAGAPKPDIRTVEGFKQMVLRAKSIDAVSTSAIYMKEKLFPRLGIPAETAAKFGVGPATDIWIRPVSELQNVPGIDFVGPVPDEIQLVSVFSAAILSGSKQVDAARRLIGFLSSEEALPAIRRSGMEPAHPRQ